MQKLAALGRFCVLLILHSSFCLLTSGCKPAPPADLVIVNGTEPESLDPAISTGVAEMRIIKGLFEGLTRYDPRTAVPVPGLAERWDVSPDGRIYTFHLRTNAAWSTGEPITAQDVVFSWLRVLDPGLGADYAGQLFYLRNAEEFYNRKITDPAQVGIRALDPRTVQVELRSPVAFFLDMCAFSTLLIVPRSVIEQYGDRWIKARPLPVSGAFTLDAWRVNDKIRLRKNPRDWDAARTASELIDFLPIGSPNTALNLYETGAADIVWDKDLIPVELLDVLRQRPDFHRYNYLGTYFFRFNVTKKPFDDPHVRRAIALATDKQRLVEKITKGGETAARHFTPDGVANYNPPDGLGYDVAQARKLLAEAGYPEGKGFPRFTYTFDAASGGGAKLNGKIAIELQQMWRDNLGLEMELRQIERKIFFNAQSRLDFDLSRSSWIGDYNDANTFLDLFMSHSGNNRTGWKNARYDDLMRRANSLTDRAARAALLREAEAILVEEEVPVVPLYFYVGFSCYDPETIHGIYPNILDEHPLQYIWKEGRGSRVESRGPDTGGSASAGKNSSGLTNH
jgi:oligopeptide transport system substrate-binding protein